MRTTKKLLALLLCLSMLLQFGITAYAAGGETNLYAEVDTTEVEVGGEVELVIYNTDMTIQAIIAGFNFDQTKLQIVDMSWEIISALRPGSTNRYNKHLPTSATEIDQANEKGSALGVYAINNGVDSLCKAGPVVTVYFEAIEAGEAKITLREETGGTDAFKSDSVETITVTIGGGSEPDPSDPPAPSCDHNGKTYSYSPVSGNTHKVTCECGEVVDDSESCTATDDRDCTTADVCKCGNVVTAAKSEHTPEADDNDCATATNCTVCGKEVTPAKAHTPEADDNDCATATNCSVCGKEVTPAKAHTPEADDNDCATATNCSVCGKEVTPAKAHTPEADDNDCATATNCSVCGKEVTPAKDHTPDTRDEEIKAPTCTEEGTKETVTFCTECGKELGREPGKVPVKTDCAINPATVTYDWTGTDSCVAQGTCQYGKVHKETVTGTTKRVTTEGNCQTKEKYVYVATFKAEWAKEQTSETFTGEKNMANHTSTEYIYVDNKDGTHTKKHACCPTEVEKGEHTWDDGVVAPDSTCLGAGVKTYTCTADGCDATYTEAVNAKGHTFGEITPAKAATCQAPGNDAYKQCTACNRYFAADAAADAANGAATAEGFVKSQLEHSYIGAYINKENGTHSQKCVNGCDQYGEPVDHTYSTDDHTCACGAVKSYPVHFYLNRDDEEPAYVAMVPYGTQFIVDWEETDALKALVNEANSALGETPSKEHYTFGGWYGFYDYQTMPAETAKIYVYWEAIQYNVTWDLAGGSFKTYWISPDTTASYNGTIGVVTDPDHSEIFVEREGYTFSHFVDQKGNVYTPVLKAVGSDMYQWDVGVMPGHDITLTAVWTINKYTLTIQYGKAIDGECNWVKEELSVPYGTKLIDLEFIKNLPASFVTSCDYEVGKWTLSGTYAFGESGDTLGSVDFAEELTMPAHDAYLDVEYRFTGWFKGSEGWTYDIDSDTQKTGWTEIDGAWYYLDPVTGVRAEGATRVPYPSVAINGITYGPNADDYASWEANKENSKYTDATTAVFVFGADGKFQQTTGITADNRYAKDGMISWHPGMVNVNGENYYFIADVSGGGNIAANGDTNVTRGFEKKGTYNFVNGKFSGANGIKDGKYYENSKLMKGNGLTKVGNEYIYVRSNGYIVVNAEYYVPANEYKIVPGMYTFNENGYLVNPEYTTKNGIVEENGDMFYYKDGKRFYAGLIKDGNDMYYVRSNGQIATGTYYVTKTNEDVTGIAPGTKLIFGADGKMQAIKNGIVEENGVKYYYKDNKLFYAGLIKDGNDMYYVRSNGQIATGTYYVTKSNKDTTGIAPGTKLVFGADGKLLPAMNGIVEENGAKYYYENGKLMKGAGVVKLTDENGVTFYIYVRSNGQLATGTYWPTIRNGYLKSGKYDWGTNGRYYPAG